MLFKELRVIFLKSSILQGFYMLIAITGLIILFNQCMEESFGDSFTQNLKRYTRLVEQKRQEEELPGVAFAIFNHERILAEEAVGYADLKTETPLKPYHIHHWFSISKTVTCTAIMQLVEQGKIDLDSSISTYIPEFAPLDPLTESCSTDPTVRHLLTHSSGIPEDILQLNYISLPGENQTSIYTMASSQFDIRLNYCPGDHISYCNMNFLVLGYLIEVVSGMDFRNYIDLNILKPAQMDAQFYYTEEMVSRAATGYLFKNDLFHVVCTLNPGLCEETQNNLTAMDPYHLDGSSYGGLLGTPSSVAQFVIALFNGEETLLKNETVEQMIAKQIEDPDAEWIDREYGLAWNRTFYSSQGNISHGGGGPGFATQLLYYPELQLGVVVFINISLDQEPYDRVRMIFTDLFHEIFIESL